MGLREKVALATVAVIAAQIVCSHCMPRSLPHCSVKSHISSLISPKADSIREFKTNRKLKKNSYNNILNGNSSQVLQLPNVKEPSDFEAGRYYRFYCDYLHEPKKLSETQFQTRNFKREAKQKRNLDLRDKRPLPIKSSGLARESPPQPYCFRKSSFFPEVEYPLSARDMWIPKYWSQLLDAEVPRNVKTDAPINQNEQKNTKPTYLSYENSPLHDIIKTLNNHNTGKIDHSNLGEFIPKTSEDKSIHDGIYPYQYPNTSTTVPPDYTAPDIHSGVLPHTKMTIEAYPVPETASTSSPGPPVTSATPTLPNIPATIASVTSSDLRNIDFDIIGATTTLPFDDFTSPITESIASADNFTLLPTTVKSMQTQEREASLSETNIEPTVTPELVPFLISSTVKKPEQELRDHTTPTQSTTMSPMKSSDVINSDFNEIGVSTASPSDLFTSPVTQSIASANNLISLPNTIASMQTQEQGASRSDTNIEPTATPVLVSFISSTEKNPEQQLKDYTTPIQSTTLSPKKSSDVIYSDFDEIGASTVSPSDLLTSPVTQSLASADNFISLPTTIASVQTQERQTSLSETNTESSATPKLQSLISSSEKIPEQQLKDQTTPMQSATLPSTKKSNFDKFHVSTTSPSDVFTSLITHSETLADSFISHTQTEKYLHHSPQ
ncbi:uncharacterized protein [Choristoneura fumiferana]|uniref:uncharacterized protein n=1 Tax=Choristoneura fumiferana TaxID=7141 RepID=UPI003D15E9E6